MENDSQGIRNMYPARLQNYYGPLSPMYFLFSPFLNRSIYSGYLIPVLFFCLRGEGGGQTMCPLSSQLFK